MYIVVRDMYEICNKSIASINKRIKRIYKLQNRYTTDYIRTSPFAKTSLELA